MNFIFLYYFLIVWRFLHVLEENSTINGISSSLPKSIEIDKTILVKYGTEEKLFNGP